MLLRLFCNNIIFYVFLRANQKSLLYTSQTDEEGKSKSKKREKAATYAKTMMIVIQD